MYGELTSPLISTRAVFGLLWAKTYLK